MPISHQMKGSPKDQGILNIDPHISAGDISNASNAIQLSGLHSNISATSDDNAKNASNVISDVEFFERASRCNNKGNFNENPSSSDLGKEQGQMLHNYSSFQISEDDISNATGFGSTEDNLAKTISDEEFFERASKSSDKARNNIRKSVNFEESVFVDIDQPGMSQSHTGKEPSHSFDAFQSECGISLSEAEKEKEEMRILVYISLIEALYTYGCSALNLVGYSNNMSHSLNLKNVSVRLGATGFWVINNRKCDYVGIKKAVNMNKLGRVIALVREVCSVRKNCPMVLEKLDGVHSLKNIYHPVIKFLMFPLYAVGFTVFFFGGDAKAVAVSTM